MDNPDIITACKMSEHNGRDLLVSYCSGHIYRFDIYDEPGVLKANLENVRFSLDSHSRYQSPQTDFDANAEIACHTEKGDKPARKEQDTDVEMVMDSWRHDAEDQHGGETNFYQ